MKSTVIGTALVAAFAIETADAANLHPTNRQEFVAAWDWVVAALDKKGIKPGKEQCFNGQGCATLWFGDVGHLWVEADTMKRRPESLFPVNVICSATPEDMQADQLECYSSAGGAWIEHPTVAQR